MTEVDMTRTRHLIEEELRKRATPQQMEEIAETLGVTVAYFSRCCTCTHRPDFGPCQVQNHDCTHTTHIRPYFGPNQVRHLCELVVGHTYASVNLVDGEHKSSFVVMKKPSFDASKNYWGVKVQNVDNRYEHTISLVDYSILPSHNLWNKLNYIAFTESSRHFKCHAYCCRHYICHNESKTHHHHCHCY